YLEALSDEGTLSSRRNWHRLLSYAEFQFKLRGGSRCAVCRATVRYVLPVKVERADGMRIDYPCLCTRCLVAEKAMSKRVVLNVGALTVEHVTPDSELHIAIELHKEERASKQRQAKAG